MTRDMVGYGGKWPDMRWPNGARLAVSVAVNFEEGAEQQVGDGDPQCERMGEVISVVAPGVREAIVLGAAACATWARNRFSLMARAQVSGGCSMRWIITPLPPPF